MLSCIFRSEFRKISEAFGNSENLFRKGVPIGTRKRPSVCPIFSEIEENFRLRRTGIRHVPKITVDMYSEATDSYNKCTKIIFYNILK